MAAHFSSIYQRTSIVVVVVAVVVGVAAAVAVVVVVVIFVVIVIGVAVALTLTHRHPAVCDHRTGSNSSWTGMLILPPRRANLKRENYVSYSTAGVILWWLYYLRPKQGMARATVVRVARFFLATAVVYQVPLFRPSDSRPFVDHTSLT